VHRREVVLLLTLASIWGASFLFIKLGVDEVEPAVVVLGRLVVGVAVLVPVVLLRGAIPDLRAMWIPCVVLGALNNAVPYWLIAFAETRIDSGLAAVIQAAAPILTVVLATRIDPSQRVRGLRLVGVAVGFVGVLVVTRPGAGSFHPAALLSLSAAVFYALYSIITRILARTDSNGTTLFYSNIVGALVLLPVIPFVWTTPTEPIVIALMVASGAMGSAGHYFLIAAHRLAPAAVLSPFIYTEIVLVIVLGYLVFGDLPNRWTLTGAAIVVASGLYILNRERKVGRTRRISPP